MEARNLEKIMAVAQRYVVVEDLEDKIMETASKIRIEIDQEFASV